MINPNVTATHGTQIALDRIADEISVQIRGHKFWGDATMKPGLSQLGQGLEHVLVGERPQNFLAILVVDRDHELPHPVDGGRAANLSDVRPGEAFGEAGQPNEVQTVVDFFHGLKIEILTIKSFR